MTTERVGTRLRRLREARSWSQGELARRAKMHRSHIERIEDGSFEHPRPSTLLKLATALNVDVEELTGKEPLRQVTPYESNPRYRKLIDMLETAEATDRDEIVRHALWSAERARRVAVGVTSPTIREAEDVAVATEIEIPKPDGLSLAELTVERVRRMEPEQQRQFFAELADAGLFESLSLIKQKKKDVP